MRSIAAKDYPIVFENEGYIHLNQYLSKLNYSTIFVLVDTNTHEHCLARVLSNLETTVRIEVIEIDAGEQYKNIETCSGVWNALSELDGDRKSLMINVGGGVVTDLGGFVACTFKRGIDYINVPTSLLAMVDASVGGKTGV
ncbi:MAG TPA: iron-containing alcohol dehydrogenase, partial [Leeuwenhoekiella sp.]|nr:iron-containing alcohol dehydrogenase [Leeuwenhoekiella sp.]